MYAAPNLSQVFAKQTIAWWITEPLIVIKKLDSIILTTIFFVQYEKFVIYVQNTFSRQKIDRFKLRLKSHLLLISKS